MKRKSGYAIAIIVFLLIIVISSFSTIVNFVTDYKWFGEIGYTKTFLTKLTTQFKIGIPAFVGVFLLILIYLMSLKKNYYKQANIIVSKDGEKKLNTVLYLATALVSVFISSIFAKDLWFTLLQFINSTDFNVSDPIFNNDLSFYIFKLPLFRQIISLVILLAFILIVFTVVFYLVMLSVRRPNNGDEFNMDELTNRRNISSLFNKRIFKTALFQIGILGFVIFLVIAVNFILKSYNLLYSARGVAYGASYTDIHVTLWVYRILALVSVLSAVLVLVGAMRKRLKLALIGPVILIAISILGNVGSGIVQKFVVEPDEISKEKEYLNYNIEFTQKAYGLGEVKEEDFSLKQNLTKQDLLENKETIKNIKINDYRPIKQVYNQLQGIRPYYAFNDIDVDRYNINGQYTQVFLSARELDQNKLRDQAKTWINQHLKYTHGYGFVLSPVNSVTSEGQPELLVRNIPPITQTDINITKPEIYFGELPNDYIIVNTDEKEFDYPQGSNNSETIYEGLAGIELGGLNRLLFTIKQASFKILISNNINSDSKIILYRNINDRIRKIASFIQYDSDPYLVVNQDDGKLYWIVDGYTMSDRYPYSQPFSNSTINYIRNSVKVVIDAYNGTTKYYVFDENDPIIMTYKKIFPDLFLSIDEMPEGIKSHTRYPQLLFNIQSEVYKVYHVDNPMVFYNGEDVWDIAKEKYMETVQNVESNYVMFRLPKEEKEEFLLTVPYTPATKPNMISLFVARNDGENYGKLFVYKFTKEKTINGPMMLESRIDQDSNISSQLTLWSQKGSTVLRGNLIVVPVEDSLLYVEPVYLKADNENSIPEVKRVIVSYKDRIVMKETLDDALTEIFGEINQSQDNDGVVEDIDIDIETEDFKELVIKANEVFNKAKEASREGNWSEYGEYIDQLENILNSLNTTSELNDLNNTDNTTESEEQNNY